MYNADEAFTSFYWTETKKFDWKYQGPIHEYFQELSQAFGFSTNESVSLYDLPQIMATPNQEGYDTFAANRNFMFTRFQHHAKTNKELIMKCKNQWKNFNLGVE